MSVTQTHPLHSGRIAMRRASIIKTIRLSHRYLGLFFAPAILFFAFSGAFQVFGWHQTSRDGDYVPARWIAEMAQLHKRQTLVLPAPKPQKPANDSSDDRAMSAKKISKAPSSKFALQCFVFVMSFALMATTLLGIIMAFLYGGDWRIACAVLLFGTLFPIAVTLSS